MKQLESLFWGAIAALGALFLELILANISLFSTANMRQSILGAVSLPAVVLGAALIEESFKYLIISRRISLFSLGRSHITNALLCGAGFATVELLLSSLGNSLSQASAFQIFSLAALHMLTSAYLGYRIATKPLRSPFSVLQILALATLFHTVFNMLISLPEDTATTATALLLSLLALRTAWDLLRIKRVLAH
ncbi:MAG TPA: PrsW family glutamic-type intramembrane protease [Candidatus Moranbacteria bacterium]|nr:PrsW family glutamic-type intramembrane protease [Candidatus Moranbacteria bacterium]